MAGTRRPIGLTLEDRARDCYWTRMNFDDALRLVREIGETEPIAIVNSINPDRIEGQKTASFEVIDVLGDAPNIHILPVGNAGNISAYWKGYREFHQLGKSSRLPRMIGFQAAGSAPIYHGKVVENPETIATAIRIGNPASWQGAKNAVAESNGHIDKVTDEEILAAYTLIARSEGIFVEPACAAPLAGLRKCVEREMIPEGSLVTATMTGHGLKDPDTAISAAGISPTVVEPTKEAVAKVLGL